MIIRSVLVTALLLAASLPAVAQEKEDTIASPVLRAQVTVESDIVRIGDMIENAGTAAQIPIYRSPDLGTTGSLPTTQVINALQAHQVIGVDTRGIKQVSVTRLARILDAKEIASQVAHALEHRSGLGEAANLNLTFDRDVQDVRLEASNTGALQAAAVRYDARNGRFDVSFEIASDSGISRTKLRFTGVAIEMIEAAVLTRNVERGELLKASDVVTERRPKAEVGNDPADRTRAVGMQMRKGSRAGQPLHVTDLGKPDLVQRDDNVTLIYEAAGIYLTMRGKAVENGTEGDTVTVLNLQSKRNIVGTVIGRGQVAVSVPTPRLSAVETTSSISATDAPVSVASRNNAQTNSNAE
ncbi:MAG TPA: flagellar basal body P-ring formation chaperone FlgA [Bradyrhizobium sp.]|uniref:flagellar basal body P-ring formation chaperone FlgA n=1 Tax=Bradyrhizobium sp. TaxID=376 RepID=UPI002D7ED4EF|nr:flagellar basal body P-ring formation chaperone FlgA [Bradyrhizobium sp.]HET7888626.1 flagellar basal body P-ring formation chaperone FlgA [Bradyrhizobium sp.]